MRTLVIDNYDPYTFNLFHLLGEPYRSLAAGAVPPELRVTARTPDGVIIGARAPRAPALRRPASRAPDHAPRRRHAGKLVTTPAAA